MNKFPRKTPQHSAFVISGSRKGLKRIANQEWKMMGRKTHLQIFNWFSTVKSKGWCFNRTRTLKEWEASTCGKRDRKLPWYDPESVAQNESHVRFNANISSGFFGGEDVDYVVLPAYQTRQHKMKWSKSWLESVLVSTTELGGGFQHVFMFTPIFIGK